MSERIQFRRIYNSFFEHGQVNYGLVNGRQFTIPELMRQYEGEDEPIEAEVEAHWVGAARPDRLSFCGATYNFFPKNGLIAAQSTTSIRDSEFGYGVVIHPNTTVHDSTIRTLTEVSNTTTIINSRIGHGCLIGSNVVIDGCKVLNLTEIQDGDVFYADRPEATGRDFKELAYDGARW